ncbi:MAG: interleukin-like EMT inducer domain-containing protein [Anaerolineae bacterium]
MINRNSSSKVQTKAWLRRDLAVLLIYGLLTLSLTWPTFTHFTTHLPGDGGDDPAIAWNLWWIKYALLNAGQNPFSTDFMFYPIGINLAFYTLTLLNGLTALPLTLNLGVVPASNLHLLFSFVAGGYGMFVLTRYILLPPSRGAREQGSGGESSPLHPCTSAPSALRRTPRGMPFWTIAALAGGFYTFASSKLFYVALGQFNIASSHWIPFAVLYVLRTQHTPRRLKYPLLTGLFFTLQAWSELTYASFLLVFIALYWIWETGWGVWQYSRHSPFTIHHSYRKGIPLGLFTIFSSHLRAVLIFGFTCALGLSPILAHMLPDLRAEGDFLAQGSGFASNYSADGLGFVIPTSHHPFLGGLIAHTAIQNFSLGQHIYLGVVLLVLFAIGLAISYRHPGIRFWLVAAVIFALLCLGPSLTFNGHNTGLPGPFVLLQNLPFFKGNRYPSRYSVMLLLSLSVIAAFALAKIAQWANRHHIIHLSSHNLQPSSFILPFVALLFLLEHLSAPLPQSDMHVPQAYQTIAADPGDFTVLDLPLAWRNGFRITGPFTTGFMFGQFYQTYHQKRLLQGNTSRNPEFKFQYFTNAPLLNSLIALQTGHSLPPERREADQAIAAETLRFFNIKYIVVRPYQYDKSDNQKNITVTEQAVIPYIEELLPVEKIHDEAAIKIYRVKDIPAQAQPQPGFQIDTSSPLAPLYFGSGWGLLTPGQPVTAQRPEVQLLLLLNKSLTDLQDLSGLKMIVRLRAPDTTAHNPQTLILSLNGWRSPPQTVTQEWQELTFDLPAEAIQPGLNDLHLHFSSFILHPSSFSPHPSSFILPQVSILSAGEEVGNFGHIYVNGQEVSPNQRGYNVAVLPPDGALRTANFDTFGDPSASAALARFLASSPPGALIALAAADEASAKLTEEAVKALHAIGVTGDLRGCFRCSHAFIRDETGRTYEALDPLRPVGVTIGLGLTEPGIAAQVEWIRVVEP